MTGRTDYERLKGLKGQDFGAFEGQPEYLTPKTLPDGQGLWITLFNLVARVRARSGIVWSWTIRAIMESVADGSKSLLVSHGPSILQFCRRVLDPIPDIRGLKRLLYLHFTYDQGQFGLVSSL